MCDDVRQERNGKFILIGLFDVVNMASFPVVVPRICIVNRWCCGQGEYHEQTRIVGADSSAVVVESKPIPVRLPNGEATVTNVEFFLNIRFDAPGVYWIEVLLDGDMVLRYPLHVNRIPPPKGEGGGGAMPA
jgi:hypothetical protein